MDNCQNKWLGSFTWPPLWNGLCPEPADSFPSCPVASGHPGPTVGILLGLLLGLSFLLHFLASPRGFSGSPEPGTKPRLLLC